MTYEEISEKYPIGKLLAREKIINNRVGYWVGQADKDFYLNNYTNVKFYDNFFVEYTEIFFKEYRVEGWIVNSEGFFVAENTWDGWQSLDQDELDEIESKGIIYEGLIMEVLDGTKLYNK